MPSVGLTPHVGATGYREIVAMPGAAREAARGLRVD